MGKNILKRSRADFYFFFCFRARGGKFFNQGGSPYSVAFRGFKQSKALVGGNFALSSDVFQGDWQKVVLGAGQYF